ncbi:MAG: cobalt-zinc-cadmium resistance protein [Ignavibacteria bacterium RIFOXYB2_FULL_35_12]|nr:MAG: cobalt-zinc-cadmium resistance protein [Ignavibacteria bacterium GWF2_35_20]OGU87841.1 MAG: cobalt-zinc-cadmium resistance protein [Ignavibacteria bacterium RIFOXYA12_FULL_35_25]OGU91174.1 MAG: cobalt-zinc-cadmium resistance protein [Ignavibacteria bacterium RIFOXYC12_FULL_35_11]OGU97561.1 MAG: cobalt-zinc-cadmium resistance protein [Ignavibacteria bacterium RIFOXYB12_FULL_35_14]OGV00495.1 MAG: cobalt-zinc-cadmium resistance protein [Ignavibacteria bacterium RIFOXYC2_FULL_35_16]OGV0348
MPNRNSKTSAEKGIRSTLIGIIVSIFLAIIKGTAGVLGNSYALIADAIESTSDVFTSFIVLTGLKIASKPADIDHPYGHGKAEPIAGMMVASALFIAAVIIIIQSTHEIITPHHAPAFFTLIVLVAVVITKELLFRFVIKIGENIESTSVKIDAWHHRSDAITSFAAFIGISVALIGGKGYEEADDYAALFASGIIIFNAYRLFKPAFSELMDTAPPIHVLDEVKSAAGKVNGVMAIDKCFVRKMGLEFFVDIHVVVDRNLPVHIGHLIGHNVKDELIKFNPKISDVLVHIEPTPVKI